MRTCSFCPIDIQKAATQEKSHSRKTLPLYLFNKVFCIAFDSDETFSDSKSLKGHIIIHTDEKPFGCLFCEKSFIYPKDLRRHMRSHTWEKPHFIVHKSFAWPSTPLKHLRIYTGEKPFSCTLCPNSYAQSNHLKVHSRIHTSQKQLSCLLCEKTL